MVLWMIMIMQKPVFAGSGTAVLCSMREEIKTPSKILICKCYGASRHG